MTEVGPLRRYKGSKEKFRGELTVIIIFHYILETVMIINTLFLKLGGEKVHKRWFKGAKVM